MLLRLPQHAMKIKTVSRSAKKEARDTADHKYVRRNLDPAAHPFAAAREHQRAVVAAKLDLDAVMLTVFKANAAAQRFYVEKLKYAVDGDDPANHGVDDACYVILSRPLKRALAPSN